jgi:HEAT repeat protein
VVAKTSNRNILFPLWAGLLVISGLAPPFVGATESTVAMSVSFENGLVSVSASSVPVRDVIEAIADQAGLRLVEQVELDQQVTLDIDRQPLPDALAVLLENDSYTLFQAIPSTDNDADVIPGTLWVFSEGTSLAPAATVFYEAVLYQGTYREKKEAIRELRRLGTPAAVQALSLALGDEDARIRDTIGSDEALAAIASAAQDSDPRVRGNAAAALASGDSETSAQYLAMALDDPDPRVRMAVIESLADVPFGTVPNQLTVATLTRALQDEDPEVRMSAVDAMEEIGGDVAYQTLMQSHADSDSDMPDAIRESLFAPEE